MTAKTRVFQLKVQLREVRPPVWRWVLVPGEVTLAELHQVLQVAMGWTDAHLHELEVDGARYGVPDLDAGWDLDEVADESRVKLFQVVGEGSRLRYAYDFGDGWQHDVTVEKVLSPQPATRAAWEAGVPARRRTSADCGDTRASWLSSATRATTRTSRRWSGSAGGSTLASSTWPRWTRRWTCSSGPSCRFRQHISRPAD